MDTAKLESAAKKKICVVTGTRAEYGLFHPLLARLSRDDFFELQLIATGMHLSPEFGMTYREIEEDGFPVREKVEMLLSSDTDTGTAKSTGIGIMSFADVFRRLGPDMLVVLGDRFETFAAVVSAFMLKIPVAHLHGGELTEGVIDDAMRHCITKMSYLHFTSTEEYRRRVVQLGESPDRVHNVGAPGLDNVREITLLKREELEETIGFSFGEKNALVTYHPVTLEGSSGDSGFTELLRALDAFRDMNIIFTKANADAGGRAINRLAEEYAAKNPGRAVLCDSLGRLRYLSAMMHVDMVIGNSSSGIIEAPSFKKPTINIGDRQKGRVAGKSVIHCRPDRESIKAAVERAMTDEHRSVCTRSDNPYGDGTASNKIIGILKDQLSSGITLQKEFFDLNNNGAHTIAREQTSNAGDIDGDGKRYIYC